MSEEPKPGIKFIIPYTLVRPVEHGEILASDGHTRISNLRGEKWWAKQEGLGQKEIVVCLDDLKQFHKLCQMAATLK